MLLSSSDRIDMYVEGITDLMQMIMMFPFAPAEAKPKNLASIEEKATKRYFPVFEKVSDGEDVCINLAIIKKFPKNKNTLVMQVRSDPLAFLALTKKGKCYSEFSVYLVSSGL